MEIFFEKNQFWNGCFMQNKNLIYLFVYCICLFAFGCKSKKQNQLFTSLSSKESGIDFAICIDISGSMDAYLAAAKTAVATLVTLLKTMPNVPSIKVGFVPYRDHDHPYDAT